MTINFSKAFSSQYKEITLDKLNIEGDIPKWLSGSFVSNGPAQFEVGATNFNHWFDGFAMLKKFDFSDGSVKFQNKFLHSREYLESIKLGKLSVNEFATNANSSYFGRLQSAIKNLIKSDYHDNCVVNTTCVFKNHIAMTETNDIISFDIQNLNTIGKFNFPDKIPGHFTLAHPHFDTNNELINISIEIGRLNKYHIYKIDPINKTRKIIKTYLSNSLFYIHSFSISKNFIILFKSPLFINKYKLIFGIPFNNTLSYQKNLPSILVIIDKRNGETQELETDSFVCLHSINAYESKNELILDLICHSSKNPYDTFYLANLRSAKPTLSLGEIRRYVINLRSKKINPIIYSTSNHEFPRINYATYNGKKYQFIYTTYTTTRDVPFFNAIQKLNIQTGTTQHWKKTNYYLGEAVFVPKPGSKEEDAGVLLSIAFDISTNLSSLIIIDSITMQKLAEIFLPLHLPFGLHGNFY